jgi:DNA primase
VGPCLSTVKVVDIEDIRIKKRQYITNRAKELLKSLVDNMIDTYEITEEIKEYVRTEEIIEYGEEKLPSGPNIDNSDAIIIVEGRADVINLLRCGIKNAIAVEGTSIPNIISELSKKKTTTIFTDGDRGGELILKEALQTCDIDYIARAPHGREVEELSKKEVIKCLRSKIPIEQYIQLNANKCINENNNNVSSDNIRTAMNGLNNINNNVNNNTINSTNITNNVSDTNNTNNISYANVYDTKQLATKTDNLTSIAVENNINNEVIEETKKENEESYKICEVFKSNDYVAQMNYIISSMEELSGTGKIKIITDEYEEIKTFENLEECIDKNIRFVISDMPITQKMVDMFYEKTTTPVMVGKEVKITKKPLNLKIFTYEALKDGNLTNALRPY